MLQSLDVKRVIALPYALGRTAFLLVIRKVGRDGNVFSNHRHIQRGEQWVYAVVDAVVHRMDVMRVVGDIRGHAILWEIDTKWAGNIRDGSEAILERKKKT